MSVVPKGQIDKLQFYENHIDPFETNAVAIGTSVAAVNDLETKTVAARTAFNAQQAAQNAAKAATLTYQNAIITMAAAGADILKAIKAKAAVVGDSVYSLAEIPAPATPSPVAPPGLPYQFRVELLPNGALVLRFKCDNPVGSQGTIYQVYRKIESSGDYMYLGGTGVREFTDLTVPSGVSSIMYQVQATRSTAVGIVGEFVVNFGVSSTGAMTASVVQGTPAKIAA